MNERTDHEPNPKREPTLQLCLVRQHRPHRKKEQAIYVHTHHTAVLVLYSESSQSAVCTAVWGAGPRFASRKPNSRTEHGQSHAKAAAKHKRKNDAHPSRGMKGASSSIRSFTTLQQCMVANNQIRHTFGRPGGIVHKWPLLVATLLTYVIIATTHT